MKVKTHKNPKNGFIIKTATWNDTLCSNGLERLHGILDNYFNWTTSLSDNWSGFSFLEFNK